MGQQTSSAKGDGLAKIDSGGIKADMSHRCLKTIPPENLKKLRGLQSLNIYHNEIEELPLALWTNNTGMRSCVASHNFIRRLDVSQLRSSGSLTRLELVGNGLEDVTGALSRLGQLQQLTLAFNRLTQLSDSVFEGLTALLELNLSQNRLTSVPSVGAMQVLNALDLHDNYLEAVPSGVARCKKLNYLRLDENRIREIPDDVCNLGELNRFLVNDNALTRLPPYMSRMSQLRVFGCARNQITDPRLGELAKCPMLTELALSENPLTADDTTDVPSAVSPVTTLALDKCQLTTWPRQLTAFLRVTHLNISHNRIATIPPTLCRMTELLHFYASFNLLTDLPENLGELQRLEFIDLSYNKFQKWPASLNNMVRVKEILLAYNYIGAPSVPLPEMIRFPMLDSLNLSGNGLQSFPAGLCQVVSLQRLYLDVNLISVLPVAIGNLTSLSKLALLGNKLETLPATISQLTRLKDIDLSGNRLKTLPKPLLSLASLEFLCIRFNKISALPDLDGLPKLICLSAEGNPGLSVPLVSVDYVIHVGTDPLCESRMVGATEDMGHREYMEDNIVLRKVGPNNDEMIAIFDGHRGRYASTWLAKTFCTILHEQLTMHPPAAALAAAFDEADRSLAAILAGSTATVALVTKDTLVVGNVGDSRAVVHLTPSGVQAGNRARLHTVVRKRVDTGREDVVRISADHNILKMNDAEYDRVRKTGFYVTESGYVNDGLALCRTLGDSEMRPGVVGTPHMAEIKLSDMDVMVMGSDGLWDVMKDEEAVDIALSYPNPLLASVALRHQALVRGTTDNVAVCVLSLRSRNTSDDDDEGLDERDADSDPGTRERRHRRERARPHRRRHHAHARSSSRSGSYSDKDKRSLSLRHTRDGSSQQRPTSPAPAVPKRARPGHATSSPSLMHRHTEVSRSAPHSPAAAIVAATASTGGGGAGLVTAARRRHHHHQRTSPSESSAKHKHARAPAIPSVIATVAAAHTDVNETVIAPKRRAHHRAHDTKNQGLQSWPGTPAARVAHTRKDLEVSSSTGSSSSSDELSVPSSLVCGSRSGFEPPPKKREAPSSYSRS